MRVYENWTVDQLKNAIWSLANGNSIPGGYTDIKMLRVELRSRGLSDRGYHNT